MTAYGLFATRTRRAGLLALLVVAWGGLSVAVAIGWHLIPALLLAVVGLSQVLITKAHMEEARRVSSLESRLIQADARSRDLTSRTQGLEESIDNAISSLASSIEDNRSKYEDLRRDVDRMSAQVADSLEMGERSRQALERTQDMIEDVKKTSEARLEGLGRDLIVYKGALSQTRTLAYKIGANLPRSDATQLALTRHHDSPVTAPTLSIAIPSYNRPEFLGKLLASIERDVDACEPGAVEVAIIDDASPDPEALDVALDFAERTKYAFVRVQPHNVGLERNVLASARMCTGEYVQVVGNDDLLTEGSVGLILEDIANHGAAINLYSKGRINHDGTPRPDVAGSIPIELETGETHRFASLLTAVRAQGPLSTLGFISTNVMRRESFQAIDPTPYLDLTMYVHVMIMLEAFARQPVFYNNTRTVLHRTPDPDDKVAESLGRPDSVFMAGGRGRLSRYFGTSLAASLQRLIDRGVLTPETLASLPENLMSPLPLVEWTIHNRSLEPDADDEFPVDVVADAERFSTTMQVGTSRGRA